MAQDVGAGVSRWTRGRTSGARVRGRRETGRVSERMWERESGGFCREIKAGTNQLT